MQAAGCVDSDTRADRSCDRDDVGSSSDGGDLLVGIASQFDVLSQLPRAPKLPDVADDAGRGVGRDEGERPFVLADVEQVDEVFDLGDALVIEVEQLAFDVLRQCAAASTSSRCA